MCQQFDMWMSILTSESEDSEKILQSCTCTSNFAVLLGKI